VYRFIDQPNGWIGSKDALNAPTIVNLRLETYRTDRYGVFFQGSYKLN
jgi:hypothetical protein